MTGAMRHTPTCPPSPGPAFARAAGRRLAGMLLACMLPWLSACQRDPQPVRFFAEGQPADLADWRLLQVEDGRLRLNAGVLPYDLNTPLFSDYAHKLRTVWMPPGTPARYRAQGPFDFPVGTILSKTFYYPRAGDGEAVMRVDDTGPDLRGGGLDLSKVRLVETRLLVRREQGWVALPYVWNAGQDRATLMRGGELVPLTLVAPDGSREQADYQVPDQNQCGSCHGNDMRSKALHPIGPQARHLNRDFAYAGGAANQLARWTRAGYLAGAPDAATAPRAAHWRDGDAPLEARARAYLDINCGHCHSRHGPGNTSGLWLDASAREPLRLGRCKLPIAAGRGTGGRRYGIVPGRPDDSILAYRMESDDPSVMMPELGRSVVHDEGVALIREWIASQRGGCG